MPQSLRETLATAPATAEFRLLAIFDYIKGPIDDAIHAVGGVEPFIVQVNALYDEYIAPIDVPWVPNVLEPTLIDAPAKLIIGACIRRLHDAVHKVV